MVLHSTLTGADLHLPQGVYPETPISLVTNRTASYWIKDSGGHDYFKISTATVGPRVSFGNAITFVAGTIGAEFLGDVAVDLAQTSFRPLAGVPSQIGGGSRVQLYARDPGTGISQLFAIDTNNVEHQLTGPGITSPTIDDTYNAGHSVTVDAGPIILNVQTADTGLSLVSASAANGIVINSGFTTGLQASSRIVLDSTLDTTSAQLDVRPAGTLSWSFAATSALFFVANNNGKLGITSSGAAALGTSSTAIGYGAVASSATSIAFGHNASATTNGSASAIGESAVATGANSIALGQSASATGGQGTALGSTATANFVNAVAVGFGSVASANNASAIAGGAQASGAASIAIAATASASNAIAIGAGAHASGANAIALGASANAAVARSIAIGLNATTVANGQVVFGSDGFALQDYYFGSGISATVNRSATIHASGGSGTDSTGGNFIFAAGIGTGAASTNGSLLFQTATPGSTGTTPQTLSTRLTIDTAGLATFAGGVQLNAGLRDGSASLGSSGNLLSSTGSVTSWIAASSLAITFTQVQTALAAASSAISVNSQKITSLATPTVSTDAANKGYVDGAYTAGTGLTLTSGAFSVNYGATSITACVGNDSRLSDARAPTGSASGDLGSTYPSPTVTNFHLGSDTRGDIAVRGATAWGRVAHGTATQHLGGDGTDTLWINDSAIAIAGEVTGTLGASVVARSTNFAWTGTHSFASSFAFAGTTAPTALSGTVNNYDPTGSANWNHAELSASADSVITGLAGGSRGRRVIIENTSAHTITLNHGDTGSTSTNRFSLPGAANLVIQSLGVIELIYDGDSHLWQAILPAPPATVTFGSVVSIGTLSNGSGTDVAHANHVHDLPFTYLNSVIATANADISVNSRKITSLATPITGTDAATKAYVDSAVSGGGASTLAADVYFTGIISPTALSTSQNDYSPTNLATSSLVRQDLSADVNLTGLATGSSGKVIRLENVSSANLLTLKNASASSTAANRFSLPGDVQIAPGGSVDLRYEAALSRWIMLNGFGSTFYAATGGDGSTALRPGYAFAQFPGTGVYAWGTGGIAFAVQGVGDVLDISTTGASVFESGPVRFAYVGDASHASVAISGTDSGLFRAATGTPAMTAAGTEVQRWSSTASTYTLPIYAPNGSSNTPSYAFTNFTATGLYLDGSNTWGLSAGGVTSLTGSNGPSLSVLPGSSHGGFLSFGVYEELVTIGSAALDVYGTSSAIPAGVAIIGAAWRITTTVTGPASINLGIDPNGLTIFASSQGTLTAGTTGSGGNVGFAASQNSAVSSSGGWGFITTAATRLHIGSATGVNLTAGAIRFRVYYMNIGGLSS